jgi:hypothetical protein
LNNVYLNDLLRAAAGRAVPERERLVGDIGIGRGGACAPSRLTRGIDDVNARIRAAARLARQVSLHGGISVDLGNPWG